MIEKICICGAGAMGSGIAQVAAVGGFHTILYDVNAGSLARARSSIAANLDMLVRKTRITASGKENIMGRVQFTSDIHDCVGDVVIEAIAEQENAKAALFGQLAVINRHDIIFASNTSSLSISSLARYLPQPARMVGMHFFNPAPVMKLVEVVRGQQTSQEVVEALCELAKRMGKTPVVCEDAPGFIVNHVARPYYLEALKLFEAGIGDAATIDRLMEATGFKMGPFRLMDLIGNDVNYAVSCSVYEALGRPERLRPSEVQRQKVETNELGVKTKKGYYNYE